MAKFAVIQIDHHQYFVEEGKTYTIPRTSLAVGKHEVETLLVKDGKLEVGKPTVKKAAVVEVTDLGNGDKITTRKFFAKSRYRKTTGHRQKTTTFKVVSI